jgi:hypothetical protein
MNLFLSQNGVTENIMTMIFTYQSHHSHDARTVTVRGKEVVKPVSVLDYNQSIGVNLKDWLLHSYLTVVRKVLGQHSSHNTLPHLTGR